MKSELELKEEKKLLQEQLLINTEILLGLIKSDIENIYNMNSSISFIEYAISKISHINSTLEYEGD